MLFSPTPIPGSRDPQVECTNPVMWGIAGVLHVVLIAIVVTGGCKSDSGELVTVTGPLTAIRAVPQYRFWEIYVFQDGTEIKVKKSNWPRYVDKEIKLTYDLGSLRIVNIQVIGEIEAPAEPKNEE